METKIITKIKTNKTTQTLQKTKTKIITKIKTNKTKIIIIIITKRTTIPQTNFQFCTKTNYFIFDD